MTIKSNFLHYLKSILLREFKAARIILNLVREFKVCEFMYCAKMMVREL